jgi:hypothetical protein
MSGSLGSIQPVGSVGITGFSLGVNPLSDQLLRLQPVIRTVISREGLFAYMAVVRRATYAAAPFESFKAPKGYRGRVTSTRGGGAKAKFASAGFGNIIEAGTRKRHLAALQDGKTSRGQITKGVLSWIRKHDPALAAQVEASQAEAIWVRPMDPRPWVLPTWAAVQSQALEAFRAEVERQLEVAQK